jgi:HD-GYP domain-containing protein (c-di-GMP phosphodiesterase class II)
MVAATSNASLYSAEHQQVKHLCTQALANLAEAMGSNSDISLMVIDDQLIHDGGPLEDSMYVSRFAQLLKARGIGNIRVARDIKLEEMMGFVVNLAGKGSGQGARSSANLRVGTVEVRQGQSGARDTTVDKIREGLALPDVSDQEITKLMEIYEEVRKHKKLRVMGIHEIVAGLVETLKREAIPFIAIAPLRSMDEYTFTHSINVCVLTLSQAMSLRVEEQLLHDIGIAAMLHDIGKLFVPVEVINKPGALDDAEWSLIKQHPVKGAQYLLDSPGIPRLAVVLAFEHHMKFNHGGYPKVPEGWQQNFCSHMTTISDFFDAMHTKRSYRKSLAREEIASIMQGLMGTDLQPFLTKNFFHILKRLSLNH